MTVASNFFNRELSWLAFNARVLDEAIDPRNRLLERARFAAIVAANLDEFFMVRVAELKHAVRDGDRRPGPCGLGPAAQLDAIAEHAHAMVEKLYATTLGDIVPALRAQGLDLTTIDRLSAPQRAGVATYFHDDVLPALTPLAIGLERPFPMLASLALNLAFWLAPVPGTSDRRLAVVQLPARLSRLVRVSGPSGTTFVLLEDVIRSQATTLFPGQDVLECAAFRLARDSEVEPDDEGASYVEALQEELRRRRRSSVVRVEVDAGISEGLVALLMTQVKAEAHDVYPVRGPLDLRLLFGFVELPECVTLVDPPRQPVDIVLPADADEIFAALDAHDVLLHHPYDAFDPVVRFVEAAAGHPDVIAIKQTLYRTSGDSPIVRALTAAADRGKQVTVIVELRARFDEERNIQWAQRLEDMGAHVIYGVRDHKVHAKICLVVKRTPTGVRRYLHLGTGNYNDRTARVYTDMGLLTSAPAFGAEASAFFSMLTGYADPPRLTTLAAAPHTLRDRLVKLIDREVRRARAGQPAMIRAKMNALTDVGMIEALYAASQEGVQIRLNVRGVCALRPGVSGLSDRISVVSVIGRFLEHARIFVFHNGGDEQVYLSSADWMTRNLDHRVELLFPIEDAACAKKVVSALDVLLADTVKGRRLAADGTWRIPPPEPGAPGVDAQAFLEAEAARAVRDRASAELDPLSRPAGRR